jgi:hypothetical protein
MCSLSFSFFSVARTRFFLEIVLVLCALFISLQTFFTLQCALVARVYRVIDASVLKQCVQCVYVPRLYQVLV